MSAATLRDAALVLRERAQDAYCKCGSTACTAENGWYRIGEATARLDSQWSALFMVLMTPAVGLALAECLDQWAERLDRGHHTGSRHSHRIADLILSEAARSDTTHKATARQRPDGTWEPACRCGCIANHVPAGAYPHDNAADAVEHAQQLLYDAEHGPAL